MNTSEFRQYAHQFVDWMADFLENVEKYPVKAQVQPREIYNQIPDSPPQEGEEMSVIFADFQEKILPGITHWQHPGFMAYFNGNASMPSILAEMLTATLGAQCMIWDTSPAAAELEEKMMNWLKQLMGIPLEWSGVIQDTASTGTLVALLTAREKYSRFQINKKGFSKQKFTVYASSQVHSSIDKAVKIAGIGVENLRKIPVDNRFAMIPEELAKQIYQDIQKGFQPLCVVATIGSTSSTAIDPLRKIGEICQEYSVFLHADGAHAGSATILPEMRHLIDGLELADTYLFNPHKWMMVNFDCTAYFAKDKEALIRTFEILPEYLKTKNDSQVNNYRDWGIQLGRRFRALKLWFVLRSFGAEGIQEKLRFHLALAQNFTQRILQHPDFELTAPTSVNLVCFRYKPAFIQNTEELNEINAKILNRINEGGKLYLTHTKLNDIYTIRAVFGQTNITERQLEMLWEVLLQAIREGFGSSLRG